MNDARSESTAAGMGSAFVRLVPIAITASLQAVWIADLLTMSSADWVTRARRDWHQFFETGQTFVAGDLGSIYPQDFARGYLWLYPPYCIYLTAPLGLLPEGWAYVACVTVQVAAVLGALALVRAALPAPRAEHTTAAIVVLGSMPFNTTIAIGQISGTLALVLAASLWAWQRDRPLSTGLLLALMFIKPNLAVIFPAVCVLTRQWRVLAGIVLGCALMLLSTLPLGLERWHEYVLTARSFAAIDPSRISLWKQLTLYGFWHALVGMKGPRSTIAAVAWALTAGPLLAVTAAAWRRRWTGQTSALPRLFGLTVLLVLSANLYAYFYDGLLLLFPGIVWYVRRREYHCRGCHRLIGACILLLFIGGHVTMFVVQAGVVWLAPLIAIWLLAEAYDLLTAPVQEGSGA